MAVLFSHPLHALVLVVRRLLDAVHVVLEGGVTAGVVLLLLQKKNKKSTPTRRAMETSTTQIQAKHVTEGKRGEGFGGMGRGIRTVTANPFHQSPWLSKPSGRFKSSNLRVDVQ